MYVLLLVILNSSGSGITSEKIKFFDQTSCLRGMSEILELEKDPSIRKIKARCVKL